MDVNVDLGGTISNFFGNGLIDMIVGTFNSQAETIICSLVAGYVNIIHLALEPRKHEYKKNTQILDVRKRYCRPDA